MMKLPAAARRAEAQHMSLQDKRDISLEGETLQTLVIYRCHCF